MTRTIKRYGNRKLYDVDASAYVSLEDIAALIRAGATVEVVDNVSGDDITAQTLTQIVLDEGKRGKGILPTDLLHDLLRRSTRVIDSRVEQIKQSVDGLVQGGLNRLTRVVQGPQAEELRSLREQLSGLESTLAQLLDEQESQRRTTVDAAAKRAPKAAAKSVAKKKRKN
jgi:polyhydroxyalkanoate synthesis repressor PhaR